MGCGGCGYGIASGQANWANPDPIGEVGGINLYGFVGNNPVNLVDPYGLDAVFTFAGGSNQTASTALQFVTIANTAAPGSISDITVTGHTSLDKNGGADTQDLGRDDNQGSILQTAQGQTVVAADDWKASEWQNLSAILGPKMATNGTIHLKGCQSGVPTDPSNIAKAISKALPNTPVTGQNQKLKYIPWTDVTVPIPFYNSTTTYLNGTNQ
jgi:hypothetical protein